MKKILIYPTLSILALGSAQAVSLLGSGDLNYSAFEQISGTQGSVGATYTIDDVGTVSENGRSVRLTYEVITVSNISIGSRGIGTLGYPTFGANGSPAASPYAIVQARFNYMDGAEEAASISNLSFFSLDIDGRAATTSNTHLFSEVVGVHSADVLSTTLSADTRLTVGTVFQDGYTTAQLTSFTDGNVAAPGSGNTSTSLSDDYLDYTFSADLAENSSYDLIFGLTGSQTAFTENRINRLGFTINAVPEPSSSMLLALGAVGFMVRRKR